MEDLIDTESPHPLSLTLVVIFSSFITVLLLPVLLIFITQNNKKESEQAHKTGINSTVVGDQLLPPSRMEENNNAKVQADVRQAGSIVEACVTKELQMDSPPDTIYSNQTKGCANTGYLTGSGQYARTLPSTVTIFASPTKSAICVASPGSTITYWYSTSEGQVVTQKPASCN